MNSWTVWAFECVENKIQRGRLRWFGHVERKEENNWVKKCTRMNVIGVVDRGAPRKTWRSCVQRDMKAMGIKEEMAQDRSAWRNITGGPTRASADAWNTVCVFGVTDVKRIWWWWWSIVSRLTFILRLFFHAVPVLDRCLQTWTTPVLGPVWISRGEGFSPKGCLRIPYGSHKLYQVETEGSQKLQETSSCSCCHSWDRNNKSLFRADDGEITLLLK